MPMELYLSMTSRMQTVSPKSKTGSKSSGKCWEIYEMLFQRSYIQMQIQYNFWLVLRMFYVKSLGFNSWKLGIVSNYCFWKSHTWCLTWAPGNSQSPWARGWGWGPGPGTSRGWWRAPAPCWGSTRWARAPAATECSSHTRATEISEKFSELISHINNKRMLLFWEFLLKQIQHHSSEASSIQ